MCNAQDKYAKEFVNHIYTDRLLYIFTDAPAAIWNGVSWCLLIQRSQFGAVLKHAKSKPTNCPRDNFTSILAAGVQNWLSQVETEYWF